MTAHVEDIETEQGATYTLGFVYHRPVINNDGTVQVDSNGDPVPGPAQSLAGCTARMQIRAKVNSEDAILTATSQPYEDFPASGGRIILEAGGETGRIDIVLTDLDTDLLVIKKAVYDLELQWPQVTGEIRPHVDRILEGAVTNTLNVTKVAT